MVVPATHVRSQARTDRAMRCSGRASVMMAVALGACSTAGTPPPHGTPGFDVIPAAAQLPQEYRIGPGDTLNITTFEEKDLTLEDVAVDASGNILLPLIGNVHAAGLTSGELAHTLAQKLDERYLRNPQVSVIVSNAVSQKVTVEGSVTQAGVFDLKGDTTLLQALALARGPNRTANLSRVAVFRNVSGRREFAVFDVNLIRSGAMPDPALKGNDVVVVPFSGPKGVFRDVLQAAPLLGVFAYLR